MFSVQRTGAHSLGAPIRHSVQDRPAMFIMIWSCDPLSRMPEWSIILVHVKCGACAAAPDDRRRGGRAKGTVVMRAQVIAQVKDLDSSPAQVRRSDRRHPISKYWKLFGRL